MDNGGGVPMPKTKKDKMEILNLIRQILKGEDANVKSGEDLNE